MRDHFIPCLLLARFSVDGSTGRKARVYQFNVRGPHPNRPVPAKDLAHAGEFYEHSQFPDLDAAGLRSKESAASFLIQELVDGVAPQSRAAEITSFITVQAARTKAFRDGTAERINKLQGKAFDAFQTSKGVAHLRSALQMRPGEQGAEALLRLGISKDLVNLVVSRLGVDGIRRILNEAANPSSVAETISKLRTAFATSGAPMQTMTRAQVKALHSMVSNDGAGHILSSARWVRLESPKVPLILGDACVVCVGTEGAIGWPFKFGQQWSEIYLPIGRNLAIVGIAADGPSVPTLDAAALNEASAGLSHEYIYASRCTSIEMDLAAKIGSIEPLITDSEVDTILDEKLRNAPPSGAN